MAGWTILRLKKAPIAEGDSGRSKVDFGIAWDGDVPSTIAKVEIKLKLKGINTDAADGLQLESAGGTKTGQTLSLEEKPTVDTEMIHQSFSVTFNGDLDDEDYESFGVELDQVVWTSRNGSVRTEPVGKVAYGCIANDDDPAPGHTPTAALARQQIYDLAQDGTIDAATRDDMLDQFIDPKKKLLRSFDEGPGNGDGDVYGGLPGEPGPVGPIVPVPRPETPGTGLGDTGGGLLGPLGGGSLRDADAFVFGSPLREAPGPGALPLGSLPGGGGDATAGDGPASPDGWWAPPVEVVDALVVADSLDGWG